MSPPSPLLDTATASARAGGAVLRRLFGDSALDVRRKGANDFVTRADRESEEAVISAIRERFPDHRILTEEAGVLDGGDEHEWVIDPLDGTTNFLQGLPVFCVSVACRRRGELLAGAVYEPLADRMFAAARGAGATLNGEPIRVSRRAGLADAFLATGYPFRAHAALDLYLEIFREIFLQVRAIRRCGAAALDLAHTAAGVYDGFFEFRLSPWDLAAGVLLVREAGGRVSDLDGGERFLENGNVVAGAPGVQPELLRVVAGRGGEAALAALTSDPATREAPVGAR